MGEDRKFPQYTDAVYRLIHMQSETIYAKDISPVVHISPDVIIKYAKTGMWDQERMGKFIVSGNRVKFLRKDFLQKAGFIPEDPPEESIMQQILDQLIAIRGLLENGGAA